MPNRAVVVFDVGVLLGLAGLDVLDRNAPFLGPYQQFATDVFRAVVGPYGSRLAAPFDDAVEAPDDAFGRQREVDLDPQPLAVEVIEQVQQTGRLRAVVDRGVGTQEAAPWGGGYRIENVARYGCGDRI